MIALSDFPPLDVIPGGAGHGPAEKRSDPDDVQSMVRFLVYANEFDVEGLVASAGTFANIAKKQNILDILDLYVRVDSKVTSTVTIESIISLVVSRFGYRSTVRAARVSISAAPGAIWS